MNLQICRNYGKQMITFGGHSFASGSAQQCVEVKSTHCQSISQMWHDFA